MTFLCYFCGRDLTVWSSQHSGPSSAKHLSTCLTSASDSCAFLDQGQLCWKSIPKVSFTQLKKNPQCNLFSDTPHFHFQSNFWINKQKNKMSHPSPAVWQRHYVKFSLYGLRVNLVLWHVENNKGAHRQVIMMLLGVWHWIFEAVSHPKG